MKRFAVKPRKDKKKFARTASKTKDINIGYKLFRGGIRF